MRGREEAGEGRARWEASSDPVSDKEASMLSYYHQPTRPSTSKKTTGKKMPDSPAELEVSSKFLK